MSFFRDAKRPRSSKEQSSLSTPRATSSQRPEGPLRTIVGLLVVLVIFGGISVALGIKNQRVEEQRAATLAERETANQKGVIVRGQDKSAGETGQRNRSGRAQKQREKQNESPRSESKRKDEKSPRQRVATQQRLARAALFVRRVSVSNDALVNDKEALAALMRRELKVPVITQGRPKRGEVLLLDRRGDFVFLAISAGKRAPLYAQQVRVAGASSQSPE